GPVSGERSEFWSPRRMVDHPWPYAIGCLANHSCCPRPVGPYDRSGELDADVAGGLNDCHCSGHFFLALRGDHDRELCSITVSAWIGALPFSTSLPILYDVATSRLSVAPP